MTVTSEDSPRTHSDRRVALIAALVSGGYAAVFYGVGNLTLLNVPSALLVVAGLVLPIVLLVLGAVMVLEAAGRRSYVGFVAAFLCVGYLLLALRTPIFQLDTVQEIRDRLSGATWWLAHALYLVLPAASVGFLFRRHLGKLTAILAAMAVAAVGVAARDFVRDDFSARSGLQALQTSLDRKPDIYLLLSDGFSSFAYMQSRGIDVSRFRQGLIERGFRVYDDTFSNYHATTDSMLAMLDMRHHFYQASRKSSEVSRTAREAIGGKNTLVRVLRANGYRTEYIHHADYLLLQGCSADYCFPAPSGLAGARAVFRELLPKVIAGRDRFARRPLNLLHEQLSVRLAGDTETSPPRFTYLHLFRPGHAPNAQVGRCIESEILRDYSHKVALAADAVTAFIDRILAHDRNAVIVVSGDHGPFIANRCDRTADIDTPDEYRDRLGTLTAIRWPDDYDGRFDDRIRTNVNVFRYVLASMIDGSTEALGGPEPDDAFAQGEDVVLKVVEGGKFRLPPERLTPGDLRNLNAERAP